MRSVIMMILIAILYSGVAQLAFAADGSSAASGKCPQEMKEVSSGGDDGVTVCCPDTALTQKDEKPHGSGGGNSGGPNGAQVMAAKNKAMIDKVKNEAAGLNKKNQVSAETVSNYIMDKCLAGINSNIFSSLSNFNIGSLFKDVMGALVGGVAMAACNLVHETSQNAINTAIDKATINLPGIGSVGANTTVLGYSIVRSDTINGVQNSSLMSKRPPANVNGVVIFQRGGGAMMNRSGIGSGMAGSVMQNMDSSALQQFGK